jgi:protein-tyrosine phosphatase
MAEGILKARLSPRAAEFAMVRSAGIAAAPDLRASAHSITVCREQGIDISGHRSQPLNRERIDDADLLLVMEEHHRDAIVRLARGAADRTFVLSEFATGGRVESPRGVPDPIGLGLDDYRRVYDEINDTIERALPRIEAMIASADQSA